MQGVAGSSEGSLIDIVIGQYSIPDALLKVDKSAKLAWINRHNRQFGSQLAVRYGRAARSIDVRAAESGQLLDLPRKFKVTVASTSADNHASFGVANIDRPLLQPNDVMYPQGLYATARYEQLYAGQVNAANTAYDPRTTTDVGARPVEIHYATTQGYDVTYPEVLYRDNEQIKVVSVGDFDSAGAGNTKITVQRFYSAPHARDLGGLFVHANNQTLINSGVNASNRGAIAINTYLFRGTNSFSEGSGNPYGVTKNPERLIDFTQEYKYAIDWTEESEGHATYFDMSQKAIAEKLLVDKMALDHEYGAIFGRKGRANRAYTMEEMTSGGILEWIPTDAAHNHTLDATTLSFTKWLDFTLKIAELGGSNSWSLNVGNEAYNAIVKAYANNSALRFNKEESKRFGMEVNQIVGSGITIDLMPVTVLSDVGRGNEGFLMDNNYPILEPLVYKDWDLKVKEDATDGTTTMKKKVIMAIKGYARRFPHYTGHLRLTNM